MTPESVTFKGEAGLVVGDRWAGSGDRGTVLLLHGGAQTRHSWSRSGPRFAEAGWTTYALDARGHGDSDWDPAGDYSMESLVADLVTIIDQMGDSPVLIGASMGGITSLIAEGENAPLSRALVLVDIATRAEPAGIARIVDFMRSAPDGFGSLEEVADVIAAYNPHRTRPKNLDGLRKNVRQGPDGRWRWHWDPAFLRVDNEPSRETRESRLDAAAAAVKVPTMLVRGAASDVVSADGANHLKSLVPHAILREAEAGHMVAGDDNDVFVTQVVEFLDAELP